MEVPEDIHEDVVNTEEEKEEAQKAEREKEEREEAEKAEKAEKAEYESDLSEGSDSKYHDRKFSEVSDLVDENLVNTTTFTSGFSVIVLLILLNIYVLFFGSLFVDVVRGEL